MYGEIIYATVAIKSSNRQCIYPRKVIYKVIYLLLSKVHLNNSYKFTIIHMGSSNAKSKQILSSKFTFQWQHKCEMGNYRS